MTAAPAGDQQGSTIRVIILDDHLLVRQGIRSVLSDSPHIVVVGEGGSGEELEQLMQAYSPDIALLDLSMPQRAGTKRQTPGNTFRAFSAISWITRAYPRTRILVISQYLDPAIVEGTAEAGVMGYILKDDELSRFLPEAIRTIHDGGIYFSEAITEALRHSSERNTSPKNFGLTPRHIGVLRAIVNNPNLSIAEQARRLGIAQHTLRNHIRHILERMGVNNLNAAVVKAIQFRVVDISTPQPPDRQK